MPQPHITELFEKKQPQFNWRKQKMTENHLNWIYSTRVKKQTLYLLFCCIMIKWMIVSHATIMKNRSIDQLKWNWVDPQAERPNAASAKLNPCLNTLRPLSGLTAAVMSGGGTEELMSPDGSFKGDGLESPLWPLLMGLQDCPPTVSVASLAVWPFKWPLDTVHVSHVWLWTAARSAAKY